MTFMQMMSDEGTPSDSNTSREDTIDHLSPSTGPTDSDEELEHL